MDEINIETEGLKVGFIGTGMIGAPMAGHFLAAGYALHIYTRTQSKAVDWVKSGAVWENTPAAVPGLATSRLRCSVCVTRLRKRLGLEARNSLAEYHKGCGRELVFG